MNSFAAPSFWELYQQLPQQLRALADKNYALWRSNPRHPSLHFKPVTGALWSARVGGNHRALGKFLDSNTFLWLWIGTHEQYELLLGRQ